MKQYKETNEFDKEFESMNTKISMTISEQKYVLNQINMKIDSKLLIPRQKPFQWKYYIVLTAVFFIMIILSLPLFSNTFQNLAGGFNKDESFRNILNDLDYDKIIHQEEVANGVIIFYDPKIETSKVNDITSELSAVFIKETFFGWEKTNDKGGFSSGLNGEISRQFLPKMDRNSPFPMLYGEILNPDVNQVKVINLKNNRNYNVETVITESHRIWFAFLDENHEELYEVQGFTKSNKFVTSLAKLNNGIIVDLKNNANIDIHSVEVNFYKNELKTSQGRMNADGSKFTKGDSLKFEFTEEDFNIEGEATMEVVIINNKNEKIPLNTRLSLELTKNKVYYFEISGDRISELEVKVLEHP
ncbi:hypothetical protein ACLM5H_18245 [Fredinandcohnia humi]